MENHDEPILAPQPGTSSEEEIISDQGPIQLKDMLPGVIEEIHEVASDPVKQANRTLIDLQKRKAQGDPAVSDADIAAARADVEDALVNQHRPPTS